MSTSDCESINGEMMIDEFDLTQEQIEAETHCLLLSDSTEQLKEMVRDELIITRTLDEMCQAGYPQDNPDFVTLRNQLDNIRKNRATMAQVVNSYGICKKNSCNTHRSEPASTPAARDRSTPNTLAKAEKVKKRPASKKTDDDGFLNPRKVARNVSRPKPSTDVATSNKFESLNTEESEEVVVAPAPEPKKIKIRPIFLKLTENYNEFLSRIYSQMPETTNRLAGNFIKIFPKTEDDHRAITKMLTEEGAEYFITTPPATRPLKVVVKGLPINTNPDDIGMYYSDIGFDVMNVTQMTRFKTKNPLPIFIVEIPRDENMNTFLNHPKCMFFTVRVELLRKRKGHQQCYNCQFWGHNSAVCHMKPRCLKCGDCHRTGECKIKEKMSSPLCINCNKEGHVGSWRGCPVYPKPRPERKFSFQNHKRVAGKSYAQAAATPPETHQHDPERKGPSSNHSRSDFSDLFEIAKEIKSLLQAAPTIISAFRKMKNASSPVEKLEILVNSFLDYAG